MRMPVSIPTRAATFASNRSLGIQTVHRTLERRFPREFLFAGLLAKFTKNSREKVFLIFIRHLTFNLKIAFRSVPPSIGNFFNGNVKPTISTTN
jgi:hypothetical protein